MNIGFGFCVFFCIRIRSLYIFFNLGFFVFLFFKNMKRQLIRTPRRTPLRASLLTPCCEHHYEHHYEQLCYEHHHYEELYEDTCQKGCAAATIDATSAATATLDIFKYINSTSVYIYIHLYLYTYIYIYIWRRADCLRKCTKIRTS